MDDREEAVRKELARAIRRLNILEALILGAAALVAILGGGLLAWFLSATVEAPFRISWLVFSVLFFAVPGLVVLGREISSRGGRNGREGREEERTTNKGSTNGG